MSEAAGDAPSPETVLGAMERNGAGHVVRLPDCATGRRFQPMPTLPEISGQPGPVLCASKAYPEVENMPIGARARWHPRRASQMVADLRKELGTAA